MTGGEATPIGEHVRAGPLRLASGDLAGLDQLDAEAMALFVFSDVRPLCGVAGYVDWRLCGALSRTIEEGLHGGEEGEAMLLPSTGRLGRRRLFVFGLGPVRGCSEHGLRRACRRAFDVMARAGVQHAVLAAPQVRGRDIEAEFVAAAQAEIGAAAEHVSAILVEKPTG